MNETINTTETAETVNSDWEKKQDAHGRLHAELKARNKATLFDALNTAGIASVVVSFDGYGDSGQIENIEVEGGTNALPGVPIEIIRPVYGQTEPERSVVSLADAVERVVYDLLEQTHCGWEDNEGAYGEFTFDVLSRKITLDYNERYIESANHQQVF